MPVVDWLHTVIIRPVFNVIRVVVSQVRRVLNPVLTVRCGRNIILVIKMMLKFGVEPVVLALPEVMVETGVLMADKTFKLMGLVMAVTESVVLARFIVMIAMIITAGHGMVNFMPRVIIVLSMVPTIVMIILLGVALDLNPVVLVFRHHFVRGQMIPMLTSVEMRAGIDLHRLGVLAMMLRVQVQMSDFFIILVTIALLFMIMHKLIHQLVIGLMMVTLTIDPSSNVIVRMRDILNEVLNIVLALIQKSVSDAFLLDLLLR